jgi:VCBS repeat-containing protein
VFFYWVKVTATAGSNTFTISQAITTGNVTPFFNIASGSFVYNSSCSKAAVQSITQSGATTTVNFTAPTAGTYFIGIKYDTGSVVGATAPSPTTVHYTFSTDGVASSTSGLDLIKK